MKDPAALLAALAAPLLTLVGCSEEPSPPPELVRAIKTVEVSRQPVGQVRRFSGVLASGDRSELSFQVDGRIREVAVDAGARVRVGQLLASIDPQPYLLRRDSSIADLQSARADQRDAEKKLSSARNLVRRGIGSRQDYDSALSRFESAGGSVQAAEATLNLAERDLDQTVLVAPTDGTVAERRIEPFQEIESGDTAIVIYSEGGLEAQVRIPETLIHEVHVGQPVVVEMTTRIFGAKRFTGHVIEVGAAALEANAYPVAVAVEDPDPRMRPGMTTRVEFTFRRAEGHGWLLPVNAVLAGDASSEAHITEREVFVFVYEPESSTVERRGVRISAVHEDGFEISEGLADGEIVAAAGVHFLRDGQVVRPLEDALP